MEEELERLKKTIEKLFSILNPKIKEVRFTPLEVLAIRGIYDTLQQYGIDISIGVD